MFVLLLYNCRYPPVDEEAINPHYSVLIETLHRLISFLQDGIPTEVMESGVVSEETIKNIDEIKMSLSLNNI